MTKKKRGPRKTGLTPAFSIQLFPDHMREIEQLAKRKKVSKGQVIRWLVRQGLRDHIGAEAFL